MYGKSPVEFPRRIVCLSAEHVEICYALGAGERVVGIPGTAERPAEARSKPKVGGFTTRSAPTGSWPSSRTWSWPSPISRPTWRPS